MNNNNSKKYGCGFFFNLYFIGCVLFIFLGPIPRKVGGRGSGSPQKACYSNIRVIQGAVEMYNMDSSKMMSDLKIGDLRSGKYLKEDPEPPKKECSYEGSRLDEEGSVYCTFHGDLQGITPGLYNGEPIRIWGWQDNKEYYLKHCIDRTPFCILWPILTRPDGMTTFCK